MANELCVICGQKPGTFRSTTIACGNTIQVACKSCEKELKGFSEIEICRKALIRGIAENPERIRARIELLTEAEDHRPKCLRCGSNLTFMKVQTLDNSPMKDSIFMNTFDVLPAYCESCGKYEFYNPEIIRKDKYLAYLIWKDSQGE